MALSILSYPSNTSSVTNEMLFVINEATKANDEVTYPDYKYVLDVYVDSTIVARIKVNPDPVNRFGIFNISDILRDYVPSYGFDISSDKVDYDVRLAYQVKLGEEYDGTTYTNQVTDSERYCFRSYAARPYLSSAVLANGLASNMPSTINSLGYPVTHNIFPYFSNVSGVTDLSVTYKNDAGETVDSGSFGNSDFVANKIRQFNVQSSVLDASYALLTGPFSLRINYICSKYPVHTLAWLNPYGGYESQTFGLVSKKSIETEKKSFEKLNYQIDASGVITYANGTVFYGGKRDYNKRVKTKYSFTSHLLNEDEYSWLADMFISPEVYLYYNGFWIPVSIERNNYDYNTYQNSKLTPLQFDVEFSDQYNSQYL